MVAKKIKKEMEKKGITICSLSKELGMRYELLRRVFSGERKLTADEFLLILEKTGIRFEDVR